MKTKNKAPQKFGGYSNWSFKKTISEAKNIARWSPWHTHAWMKEARDMIDLDNPFYTEYDAAVVQINAYWEQLKRYRWYDEKDFWSLEGEYQTPQLLETI